MGVTANALIVAGTLAAFPGSGPARLVARRWLTGTVVGRRGLRTAVGARR